MRVTVACSPAPREVLEWPVTLATGATLLQAVEASGFPQQFPAADLQALDVGVWGRRGSLDQQLVEGDRVEIYRPLLVDPKTARRERFRKQGARGTGLFARKRPGAKPGY